MDSQNLNFKNQNLRNRSFKGQNLNGANFSFSDIRGCDFSHTSLREANFDNVKAGQTPQKLLSLIIIVLVTTSIFFHAVSQMVFGVIERTPESPVWAYAIALLTILTIAGIASAVTSLVNKKSIYHRIFKIISGTASGAILGFFYGGTAAGGKNPQVAIISAILGALIMVISCFLFKRGFIAITLSIGGAVTNYGFAFLVGTRAIAFLSTQNFIWGFFLSFLSLTYIGLTLISLRYTYKEITNYSVTSFRHSDLTNASFKNAKIGFSDFTKAIGMELGVRS
ncbi:MAG: pentapeptide repeat-containing protein [Cyanobacteriota bacterium]|nr:pentapeptide repeat-containing protein [Cyanobacteriota bacterium]